MRARSLLTFWLVMLVLAGTGEKLWVGFAPKYLEWLGASGPPAAG